MSVATPGRIIALQPTISSGPVIRIDLKYPLSRRSPYTLTNPNYLRDEIQGGVDYGMMLSQHLRRVEGVVSTTINPYGCLVETGIMYDAQALKERLGEVTQSVLTSAAPWMAKRDGNELNWAYAFGQPITYHGVVRPAGVGPDAYLTPLGERLEAGIETILVGSVNVSSSFIYVNPNLKPENWTVMDATYDAIVQEAVGHREFTIEWQSKA